MSNLIVILFFYDICVNVYVWLISLIIWLVIKVYVWKENSFIKNIISMFDVFLINCIWDWFVEYFGFVELLVLLKVNCFDVNVINDWLCM